MTKQELIEFHRNQIEVLESNAQLDYWDKNEWRPKQDNGDCFLSYFKYRIRVPKPGTIVEAHGRLYYVHEKGVDETGYLAVVSEARDINSGLYSYVRVSDYRIVEEPE